MNATQEAKLSMYRTVELFCDTNNAVASTIPALATAISEFKTKVADIISTEQLAAANLTGIAADKTNLKMNLTQIAADIAAAVFAMASSNNNQTLKKEVDYSVSDLRRIRGEELAPRCRIIHARANANEAALAEYGINKSRIAALNAAIDAYSAQTTKPRNAVTERSTLKSNLSTTFRATDKILKEIMDKLVLNLRDSNPDFVKTYKSARIIIDPKTFAKLPEGTENPDAPTPP